MSEFIPNPSQQAVLNCRDRLCVVAGAGSGKTGTLVAALVARLAEALEPGYEGPIRDVTDILALTFTEKAAGELRERLGRAFHQLRRASGPGAAGEFWRRQAARLDRADIGTIHGYAFKLVRENAPLLGLASTPALDEDDRALSRDLVEQITDWLDQGDEDLLGLLKNYPLTTLRSMLEKCAGRLSAWGLSHLAIQAGPPGAEEAPGTGLSAFAELVAEGLELVRHGDLNRSKPYYEKVRSAMEELAGLLAESGPDPADYDARLLAAHELMKRGGDWYSKQGRPMRRRLLEALEELQNRRNEQLAQPLKEKLLSLANRLPAALAARKRRRGTINFDDILILARRLLAARPEVRRREILRRRLVVVDEFQDTNRLQADLLAYLLLSPDDDRVYDEYHSLWGGLDWGQASARFSVFGDLKQSIYRFRGAESEIMGGLRQVFDQGGGRVLALDHNYRSQEPLVRFFNTLFPAHLSEGFTGRDLQRAQRPALYPGPQVVRLCAREEAPPAGEERARRQARILSRYLHDLVSGRAGVLVESGRVPEPGDLAVLFRRFTWAAVFREVLTEAGWKCRLAVGDRPFDYAEVRGLMAAFQYLSGLDQDLNLAALLRSPLGPVSDEALTRLAWPEARGRALGLTAYFQKVPRPWPEGLDSEDRNTLEELRRLLWELAPLVGRLRPVEILERLAEERRLLPLARPEIDGEHRIRALTSFLALSRRLGLERDHQALGPAEELAEMARTWDPRRDGGRADPEEEGAVTLMTVHASKGLEFPVVILAEADSRPRFSAEPVVVSREGVMALRFKNAAGAIVKPADFRAIEAEEKALEAEENGRLFYVAATRARDHLALLGWPDPKKEADRVGRVENEGDQDGGDSRSGRSKAETSAGTAACGAEADKRETVWLEALLDCPEASALTGLVAYEPEELGQVLAPVSSTAAQSAPEREGPSAEPRLLAPMVLSGHTLAVTALCRLLADPEAFYRENSLGLEGHQADEDGDGFRENSNDSSGEPDRTRPASNPDWRPGRPFFDLSPPGQSGRKQADRPQAPPANNSQRSLLANEEEECPSPAARPAQKAGRLAPNQAGTLFHAVLELLDPRAPEIEILLRSQSARLGLTPAPAETADLAARLQTFLNSPLGQAWGASPADYRELPFRLRLPGPGPEGGGLTLTGIIDLFFLTPEGEGRIVDYKLAAAHPGPELTAYEHQLRIYAQALVSAGFAAPLQAALYFAGGEKPFIHQVELARPSPLAPLRPLLEEIFQLLLKARPLRPNRPAALNIV